MKYLTTFRAYIFALVSLASITNHSFGAQQGYSPSYTDILYTQTLWNGLNTAAQTIKNKSRNLTYTAGRKIKSATDTTIEVLSYPIRRCLKRSFGDAVNGSVKETLQEIEGTSNRTLKNLDHSAKNILRETQAAVGKTLKDADERIQDILQTGTAALLGNPRHRRARKKPRPFFPGTLRQHHFRSSEEEEKSSDGSISNNKASLHHPEQENNAEENNRGILSEVNSGLKRTIRYAIVTTAIATVGAGAALYTYKNPELIDKWKELGKKLLKRGKKIARQQSRRLLSKPVLTRAITQ